MDDRRSVSGSYIYLGGFLISWSSQKQHIVAHSSIESEYHALALATSELVWIQQLLGELGFSLPHCSILWRDNLGASTLASNPIFHLRTKHFKLDLHFLYEKVLAHKLEIRYVPTLDQTANIFSKPLSNF